MKYFCYNFLPRLTRRTLSLPYLTLSEEGKLQGLKAFFLENSPCIATSEMPTSQTDIVFKSRQRVNNNSKKIKLNGKVNKNIGDSLRKRTERRVRSNYSKLAIEVIGSLTIQTEATDKVCLIQ